MLVEDWTTHDRAGQRGGRQIVTNGRGSLCVCSLTVSRLQGERKGKHRREARRERAGHLFLLPLISFVNVIMFVSHVLHALLA